MSPTEDEIKLIPNISIWRKNVNLLWVPVTEQIIISFNIIDCTLSREICVGDMVSVYDENLVLLGNYKVSRIDCRYENNAFISDRKINLFFEDIPDGVAVKVHSITHAPDGAVEGTICDDYNKKLKLTDTAWADKLPVMLFILSLGAFFSIFWSIRKCVDYDSPLPIIIAIVVTIIFFFLFISSTDIRCKYTVSNNSTLDLKYKEWR